MLRYCLYILIFLLASTVSCAQVTIHKVWIGEDNEYLDIKSKEIVQYKSWRWDCFGCGYIYSNDTISFPLRYLSNDVHHVQNNAHKIIKLTNDTLILERVEQRGEQNNTPYCCDKSKIYIDSLFYAKTNLSKPLTFKKLYYEIHEYNAGITDKIQIDSTGLIFYVHRKCNHADTSNLEFPKYAKLNSQQLGILINVLNTKNLDAFPSDLGVGNDADEAVLAFYYNDKYIVSEGMKSSIPQVYNDLTEYLSALVKQVSFKQSNTPIKLAP